MQKFETLTSRYIALPAEDVDTDQIIPARFLKATDKRGFGENLFRDWRFDAAGNKKPSFVLNDPSAQGEILVAGKNFGCGSSREHAAWALVDYGFRVVISSFFADIFKGNALNNGLLPIQLSDEFVQYLLRSEGRELEVDLNAQTVSVKGDDRREEFEIDAYKKQCLLKGQDDIDFLLNLDQEIAQYEDQRITFK